MLDISNYELERHKNHGWINESRRTDMLWREGRNKYLSIDSKTFKKSPSVWSFKDYPCEACGKTFTQCHALHKHKKYHCKMLETEQIPKEECLKCGKMVSKMMVYKHAKRGTQNQEKQPAPLR